MPKQHVVKYAFLPALGVVVLGSALAQKLDEYRMLSSDHPAVGYRTTPADNPMETLRKRLIDGDVKLEFDLGMKNIFNSFQDDFDRGAYRDAGWVYGPLNPRTIYFGVKLGNLL